MVVVGDLGGEGKLREHSVVGGAPNIAARVQALVEPNTVVVADSTRRLLGDIFSLRDLGAHHLKGISEPVSAWAVQGVSASESRFEAVRPTELAPVIGRDSSWSSCWNVNVWLARAKARSFSSQASRVSGNRA